MRTIWWFLIFWLYLVMLIPKYSKAKKLKAENNQEELDVFVSGVVVKWATKLLNVAGIQVEVAGLENIPKVPSLFVSNHQGRFDIPILLSKLDKPKSIVAKIEMDNKPLISNWMKMFDCLFIDRDNPRQSLKVLGQAAELLKNGKSVIVFPEGTRSKSKEIGEFKAGAFRTALKAGSPIVPIAIDGTYKIMEANGNWIKPGKVSLTVLPAIRTDELSKEEIKTLGEDVKNLIGAELKK